MNSFSTVIERLSGVKFISATHAKALCPVHADTKPSLSIKYSDGRTLLHCFPCGGKPATTGILKALSLEWTDLFDAPPKNDPDLRDIDPAFEVGTALEFVLQDISAAMTERGQETVPLEDVHGIITELDRYQRMMAKGYLPAEYGPRLAELEAWFGDHVEAGPVPPSMVLEEDIASDEDTDDAAVHEPLAAPRLFKLTDIGNARRLVKLHGDDVRYVPQWKKWYCWDGRRWALDETGEVERRAKHSADAMFLEADAASTEKAKKTLFRHAVRSASAGRLRAAMDLARSEPGISLKPDQLDAAPDMINVLNGTLDLRTGKLQPHDRDGLHTKLANVNYDPDAPAPALWLKFLNTVLGGKGELVEFMRRAIGYALTGRTDEQVLFLLHGAGANGKSTLIGVIESMLGEYAQTTDFTTFLHKERDGIRNDIAKMVGARFVSSVEAGQGRRLDEPLVKQITGGDKISARFLFGEFFEFFPRFKLFLAANHRPEIRGGDYGIWRRVLLVPFDVQIPEKDRDPRLKEKLTEELPGILRWAVTGAVDWYNDNAGLAVPAEVYAAVADYRDEEDLLADFISQRCELAPGHSEAMATLYSAYRDFAAGAGDDVIDKKVFGTKLTERNITHFKSNGIRRRRGIRLKASAENVGF